MNDINNINNTEFELLENKTSSIDYSKLNLPCFVTINNGLSYGIIIRDSVNHFDGMYMYVADNGYVQQGYCANTLDGLFEYIFRYHDSSDVKILNAKITGTVAR